MRSCCAVWLAIGALTCVCMPAFADPAVAPMREEHYVRIALFGGEDDRALLCPSHETMKEARTAIFTADMEALVAATLGEGCVLGTALSFGIINAAHVNNYAQVRFRFLNATDIDTGKDVKLENPKQLYWAYSFNLLGSNSNKIEPILRSAFK